jgi:hypothetical protein
MLRRTAATIATGFLAVAGCSPSPRALSWTIELESPALRSRVSLVHAEIREGGCEGPVRYASEVRTGDPVPTPPVLRRGTWGFAAEARSATCGRVAERCDAVMLPGVSRVASVLREVTETPVCAPEACTAGVCRGDDAGIPPTDAGTTPHDAPVVVRDTGPCPDAGREPGSGLRPSLPCGSTLVTEGALLDALEVTSGTLTPIADFYHRDGICGSGCREPVIQLASGTEVRARFAMVREISLLVARQPGGGNLTMEVCGRSYFGPSSLSGSGDPGFNNLPAEGTAPIAERGECDLVIRATGGVVTIRRFDVACHVASGPPAVSVTVDGMERRAVTAPASAVLAWTATDAVSCEASGSWSGLRRLSGTRPLLDLCPGRHTYALTCTGPTGASTIDIAELTVE